MIVDAVSPTPFALLRRGNHFQYRDEDRALREFSEFEDPVQALTEECRRVLKAISAANQTQAVSSSKHSTSLRDASWSRFEDIGFSTALDEEDEDDDNAHFPRKQRGLRTTPASGNNLGRPTTPSWADFLSSGFVDDGPNSPTNMLLPPDKILPPIDAGVRQRSSQSHRPRLESERHVEPGELASISRFDLDDSFWWVWMTSLAPEETPDRKAAFGRCAVIETKIRTGRWLVMEEMVKGAAPEPDNLAYVAQKKSLFSWTRRNKGVSRSKSTGKQALDRSGGLAPSSTMGVPKTSIGPDQQAKIQAAAQQLQMRQMQERMAKQSPPRRGRQDADLLGDKTNSIMTLQPVIMKEASPAMKWANKYDKDAIREAYLANTNAGTGRGLSEATMQTNGHTPTNGYYDDEPPQVPAKEPSVMMSPSSSHMPITPQPVQDDGEGQIYSEKAVEAPADAHPAQRDAAGPAGRSTPLPPPAETGPDSMEMMRNNMASPAPDASPDNKKLPHKLHKDLKDKDKSGSGFGRLFGRKKNRQSKLPENAAADVNNMLAKSPTHEAPAQTKPIQAAQPAQASEPIYERPEPGRNETEFITPREEPTDPMPHEPPRTPTGPEPTYEPSLDASTRIDTADAQEADHEFSRFDQGPLTDQPAFAPDESDAETEDAVPPPIARQRSPIVETHQEAEKAAEPKKKAPAAAPPPQDRWAQIRKNAADRAAQRQNEEQSGGGGGLSKTTDDGDDTSGEESKLWHGFNWIWSVADDVS